jgi:hypothetical protein
MHLIKSRTIGRTCIAIAFTQTTGVMCRAMVVSLVIYLSEERGSSATEKKMFALRRGSTLAIEGEGRKEKKRS